MSDTRLTSRFVRPVGGRSLRQVLRYWRPRRLTLPFDSMGRANPDIRAWLWWNYEAREALGA